MISAFLMMLSIGALCGIVLSFASKIFYVYEDPRIAQIEGNLAGANCGGCGYAGCSSAAQAVVEGKAGPSVCIINSKEGTEAVALIMGMDAGASLPLLSYNQCEGGIRADNKYHYLGVSSCKAMSKVFGGKRLCKVGCIGLGDCVKSCNFGALSIGNNGYPVVDESKCVGCGACQRTCPKNIIRVETLTERLMKFNQYDDALAPCAQTCPAEIDIPLYIQQIKQGKYPEAVQTIRMRNPLPLSCGRVCPHPCEDMCRRGVEEEFVSINQLKRFAADYERDNDKMIPILCAPETGRKVAIIGGGPAGLSCAYFLRRIGHSPTIFEAMPHLGGMLRYGIPEYRLPKKALDWEIQVILDLGVDVHYGKRFGTDVTLESLAEQNFEAVFLGIGAWEDYKLGIEGEELDGCFTGIDFLQRIASGEKIEMGRTAAVVGGGNTAVDCARTLLRMGLEKVYMVYRRTRKEMPANEVEIVASDEEGIEFVFLAAPTRVVGNDQGKVTNLEYLKMELGEPDASGRRRPTPIDGSETLLDVDMVISAIGQSPDTSFKETDLSSYMADLALTRWNTIDNDPELLQSSVPHIFTAGDAATGPSLVIEAIGSGRRSARSIDLFLKGEPVEPVSSSLRKKHIPGSIFDKVDGIVDSKRAKMAELPLDQRLDSFVEVDLVLPEEKALKEADRCLNCCRICYNPDTETFKKESA